MLARERARQKKADDAVKLYEDTRSKYVWSPALERVLMIRWHSRLTHIKTIGAIVAISMCKHFSHLLSGMAR
jgi:hypothetical protein